MWAARVWTCADVTMCRPMWVGFIYRELLNDDCGTLKLNIVSFYRSCREKETLGRWHFCIKTRWCYASFQGWDTESDRMLSTLKLATHLIDCRAMTFPDKHNLVTVEGTRHMALSHPSSTYDSRSVVLCHFMHTLCVLHLLMRSSSSALHTSLTFISFFID